MSSSATEGADEAHADNADIIRKKKDELYERLTGEEQGVSWPR